MEENGAKPEPPRLAETSLLDKYDCIVSTKESENSILVRQREADKHQAGKGGSKAARQDNSNNGDEAPDPCLPPF
jgi:hypothetical protein